MSGIKQLFNDIIDLNNTSIPEIKLSSDIKNIIEKDKVKQFLETKKSIILQNLTNKTITFNQYSLAKSLLDEFENISDYLYNIIEQELKNDIAFVEIVLSINKNGVIITKTGDILLQDSNGNKLKVFQKHTTNDVQV